MVAQAVASVGRRTFPAGGSVTLTAGGQSLTLTGREAAMVAELALNAARVADVPTGTLHIDILPTRVRLRLERCELPIYLAEPPGKP